MMQFYQKRDFGMLISDTFTFFKLYGKNYFKNFLVINGLLIILMLIMVVVFYGRFFAQAFSGNIEGQNYYFEQYMEQNPLLFIASIIGFIILMTGIGLVMYSFPVLYLKRLSENGDPNITPDQIMGDLKRVIPKFLIFLLGMIFIILPLVFVIFGVTVLMMVILIGILLLPLIFPVLINVINFTLYDHYHRNRGFFSALSYGLRAQFSYPNGNQSSPFWKYWGSTLILFVMYYVVSLFFSMIPILLTTGTASFIPSEEMTSKMASSDYFTTGMGIVFLILQFVSMIVSMVLMSILYVNAGLMYYDSRTDLHRLENFNEIETIGIGEV